MTRAKERKIRMLMMIGFAVLSTSSLAVASFAWFTSNQKATVNTGIMTVDSVEDFNFYAYRGNDTSVDSAFEYSGVFENDFIELNEDSSAADLARYGSINGMYPGRSMIFAFDVTGRSSAKLSISKLTSNDTTRQGGFENDRYVSNSGGIKVNVGWAMNVYTKVFNIAPEASAAGFYETFVTDPSSGNDDMFKYDDLSDSSAYHRDTYLAGSEDDTSHVITLANPIVIFPQTVLENGSNYLLVSITFSNENATYYRKLAGYGDVGEDGARDPNGEYYVKDPTNGNSNCYGNLKFALDELRLG